MAGDSLVGNGYVKITPTLDEGSLKSVETKGQSTGRGFANAFSVAAGNLISGAVQEFGANIGDIFKTAFNNYANYEQLVGGVDTLFKESSGIVQKNAAEAFKSAGMSANDYMENVTGFAASMINSLGGDTEKAADYAQTAIVDMSDNANKMGTSMDELQRAYQSMARGNYGMLDSLKLGYGGTKAEMQRMLADAEKISGVHYELGNFADVTQAIHVMQVEMGIAGTTAEEGASTISGSINKLGAAWNNFLTGIFDEKADLGVLGEQLFQSIGDVLKNVIPRLAVPIQHLVMGLPSAIITTLQSIPSMLAPAITEIFGEEVGGQINETLGGAFGGIAEILPKIFEVVTQVWAAAQPIIQSFVTAIQSAMPTIQGAVAGFVSFFTENILPAVQTTLPAIFDAIFNAISGLWTAAQPIIEALASAIQDAMPVILDAISGVVSFITDTVVPVVQEIGQFIAPIVEDIAACIKEHMPEIKSVIESVMGAVKSVISAVWPVVSEIIKTAVAVISKVVEVAWPVIRTIIETVSNAIKAITETVWPIISGIVETAAGAIRGAIEGIEGVVRTVQNIFDAIRHAIEDPIGTARRFIEDAINVIRNLFNFNIEWPHIPLPHFNVWGSPNPLDWLEGNLPGFSIDWYANGGIVNGATLIGAGEAGPEMILPQQGALMNDFADRIAQRVGGGVDIHDCTFNVRKDSDIRRVAQELNTLINRQTAGGIA